MDGVPGIFTFAVAMRVLDGERAGGGEIGLGRAVGGGESNGR